MMALTTASIETYWLPMPMVTNTRKNSTFHSCGVGIMEAAFVNATKTVPVEPLQPKEFTTINSRKELDGVNLDYFYRHEFGKKANSAT